MSSIELWKEFIGESLDEHGVSATAEQVALIARDAQRIAEGLSEHSYRPCDPTVRELAETQAKLKAEREKVVCVLCKGSGRIYSQGPYHGSDSQCWKCRGEGRVAP